MKNFILSVCLLAICLVGGACSKSGSDANAPGANVAPAQPARSDVEFAREAFGRLAAGDEGVADVIDWENFYAMGEDYGAEYRKFPEDARANERKAFIEGFAKEFKESGGDVQRISNWREEWKDGDRQTVAADTPAGDTLLVTVKRRDGRQLLSALDVREK